MSESKKNFKLTRRKFVAMSSAAIAAPFAMKMTGSVPHVEAAEEEIDKKYAGIKSIVIYYSQSGNTKKIGQAIQRGITRRTGQCDIARVKEITPEELEKYDLIGVGAPTWASCPSPIVIYFCKNLPSIFKSKHFFWYITHGVSPGRTIQRGVQPLREAGLTVIGWKDWFCGASLPGHAKPWSTDGHPDEIDLAEAEAFGKAMVVHSWKISEGQTGIIPTLPSKEGFDEFYGYGIGGGGSGMPSGQMGAGKPEGGMPEGAGGRGGGMAEQSYKNYTEEDPYPLEIPSSAVYVAQIEGLPTTGRGASKNQWGGQDLKIDPDKCIQCRRCVRGCPTYNIDDSVFPFAFRTQDCEFCLYCEGICPTGAIDIIDSQPNAKMAGMPEGGMPKGDMPEGEKPDGEMPKRAGGGMSSPLDFHEAIGRFRRLIKEEDVGSLGNWEVVTTHPRHKELP